MSEMIFASGSLGPATVKSAGVVSVPVSVTHVEKMPYRYEDLRHFSPGPAVEQQSVTKDFVIDFHYSGDGPTIDTFEDCNDLKDAVSKERYIDFVCDAMKLAQYHIWPDGAGHSWSLGLAMKIVTAKMRAEMRGA